MLICLDNDQNGPLGIHVLPYCDDVEQCEGLIIKEIVKGGRIDQDGRFSVLDRIIEVNDQTLLNVNFETAQTLIGEALKDNQLRLNIVKNSRKKQINHTLPVEHTNHHYQNNHHENNHKSTPQNIPSDLYRTTKSDSHQQHINNNYNDANLNRELKEKVDDDKFNELNKTRLNLINGHQQSNQSERVVDHFNEVSPDDFVTDTFKRNDVFNASNTRRMGKKYHIRLIKDLNGLGFSITTRDNQVGQCPIYIKTILPVGAAKKDGNLKAGDRLLEVCVNGQNIEMSNKSHDDALRVLRDIETGQIVDLIVSRQTSSSNFDRTSNQSSFNQQTNKRVESPNEMNNSLKLPRQLTVDKIDSVQLDLTKTREVLSFNIPLNDTGSAGLGVSVKGKTSSSSNGKKSTDLGIFVKNIFRGGAAYKDGRLKPNDQLISINGISLLNSNNEEAMNTLRNVIKDNGGMNISSNSINLVVARVTDPMENPNNSLLSGQAMGYVKDELYDTFGTRPTHESYNHQRNMSTISSDSIKLNFYEQNYQPSDQGDCFISSQPPHSKQLTNDDFNELYNLKRKSNIYNGLVSKDSLSSDSNDQFTISTPVKTSMKSDFTDNENLNELSINKFMNNSNRTDVLIENDDQENNDPNAYRVNDYYKQKQTIKQLNVDDHSLNRSKDSQMMNLSNVTNQLSLNDDDEIGFNFQRDGFGRQSMSEKRYAQLDAKNTDTFKRVKQRKNQQQVENAYKSNDDAPSVNHKSNNNSKSLTNSDQNTLVKSLNNFDNSNEQRTSKRTITRFSANCCCFNEAQTYSQSSRSSCPYHSSSQQTSPNTDQDNFYAFGSNGNKSYGPMENQSNRHYTQQPTPFTLAAQHVNQPIMNKLNNLNQANFHSNQFNNRLQVPNYQMNNSNGHQSNYNTINHQMNGFYDKNNCQLSPQFGQWLGMKKSSSLESLQTKMHEIKKENVNYNTNQPYNTMRRPNNKVSRSRNTNESFRTAIDKSYEEYMDNLVMETGTEQEVNEEFSESGFSAAPSSAANQTQAKKSTNDTINNQIGNKSKPSSTSLGTTLSNGANEISDDEIGLIRRRSTGSSKKKTVGSGIFRTLFRFGSKKFKDKDKQKLSTPQHIKKELEEEVEKIRARKAALYEQELIQEYYKRLIDQQKFQQIVSQQTQQRQQIVNPITSCGSMSTPAATTASSSNCGTLNNKLKKQQQSIQHSTSLQSDQYKKHQNSNQNSQSYLNMQSNYMQRLNLQAHSNQTMINKQATLSTDSYDTNCKYLQTGYALQNRPSVQIDNNSVERPKSSYLFDGNVLTNGQYTGNYYNQEIRKPFATTNSHLNIKKSHTPTYSDDKSIQQFETIHGRTPNYDLKDAMQRPGSRVAIDLNEDLNQYVITVGRNMNGHEVSRPYV